MRTLLAVLLLASACSKPERDPSQWPIARDELTSRDGTDRGAAAYRRTCIGCHGVDGKGKGGTLAADLTDPNGPMAQQDDVLLGVIRNGKTGAIGQMPPHASLLDASEQTAVLAYVRATYGVSARPVAPDAGVDAATP